MKKRRSLYVSYFGLREPLVQRQVVPYLTELRRDLSGAWLLTFESVPPTRWGTHHQSGLPRALARRGILWSHLSYHKRPTVPATALDILLGALRIAVLVRRHGIDIVHCRGHVPMAMGVLAKKICPVRLIFDVRGFMPEEYVDAGVWPPDGFRFVLTKRVERRLFAAADAFVVLTERARRHLFAERRDVDERQRPLAVIPCCVDLREFVAPKPESVARAKTALGVNGRRVYVYAGQLGGWYLDRALVAFLERAKARDRSAFAMILTPSPAAKVERELMARGFDDASLCVRAVEPELVPASLLAGDVGLSFIKPCFSKISSSPTKIGEYLAAGLPVVSTAGIGDVDALISAKRAGWLLKGFDDAAYDEALAGIDTLLEDVALRERLHGVAKQELGLQTVGGPLYRGLYARLTSEGAKQ